MREQVRGRPEETHGENFELVRHFAGGFFDSEMLSVPGEWLKVAVGVLAVLLSAGFLSLTTTVPHLPKPQFKVVGLARARQPPGPDASNRPN